MFGLNWMEPLIKVGTLGVGAVVVTYLFLRIFIWSRSIDMPVEQASKHALWTGFLAWAFSSLAPATQAGIYSASQNLGSP